MRAGFYTNEPKMPHIIGPVFFTAQQAGPFVQNLLDPIPILTHAIDQIIVEVNSF